MEFELKKWDICYIKDIAKRANNKKIADNLRDGFVFPYTEKEAKKYISSCMLSNENIICRAVIVNNEAIGSIGITLKNDIYRKSAELGYWLAEEYWRKGIMTEAVKMICNEAFKKYDICRIFAEPLSENKGSRRVLEKAGFVLEGILKKSVYKNGKIADSCIYALVK
jgi:ribosomal-protein-alanine N-acetyltransferase